MGAPISESDEARKQTRSIDSKAERILSACVARATRGAWTVTTVAREGPALVLALDGTAGPLRLEISPADGNRRVYRNVGAHAYSYCVERSPLSRGRQRV